MEKANFVYRVEANVKLTKGDVAQMMAVAAKHYDDKCQEFGRITLRVWPHNPSRLA